MILNMIIRYGENMNIKNMAKIKLLSYKIDMFVSKLDNGIIKFTHYINKHLGDKNNDNIIPLLLFLWVSPAFFCNLFPNSTLLFVICVAINLFFVISGLLFATNRILITLIENFFKFRYTDEEEFVTYLLSRKHNSSKLNFELDKLAAYIQNIKSSKEYFCLELSKLDKNNFTYTQKLFIRYINYIEYNHNKFFILQKDLKQLNIKNIKEQRFLSFYDMDNEIDNLINNKIKNKF